MKTRSIAVIVAILLVGCGAGGKVCQVVDLAADAAKASCTVLRYADDDGKVQQVAISPEEARSFGKTMSAKRAAEAAAGKPCPGCNADAGAR